MKVARVTTDVALRRRFLTALVEDLRRVGHSAQCVRLRSSPSVVFAACDFSKLPTTTIAGVYRDLRDQQLSRHARFIEDMEAAGIREQFVRRSEFRPETILPEVQVCNSRRDTRIFRYVRLLQQVPTSSGVGRQVNALVYDAGQRRRVLFGAIGLTSPAYAIEDRDVHFGWTGNNSRRRRTGLRRVMQLSVCLALPPYSYLHGGKLAAILAMSDPIRAAFAVSYR